MCYERAARNQSSSIPTRQAISQPITASVSDPDPDGFASRDLSYWAYVFFELDEGAQAAGIIFLHAGNTLNGCSTKGASGPGAHAAHSCGLCIEFGLSQEPWLKYFSSGSRLEKG